MVRSPTMNPGPTRTSSLRGSIFLNRERAIIFLCFERVSDVGILSRQHPWRSNVGNSNNCTQVRLISRQWRIALMKQRLGRYPTVVLIGKIVGPMVLYVDICVSIYIIDFAEVVDISPRVLVYTWLFVCVCVCFLCNKAII